ncbi:MAG: nicotinamide riboside transporter PnuC [Burkholderiaceae bacterium]|nr:nicotinamide riboside transporter PnuC [Burkholderiaceae bacterium]
MPDSLLQAVSLLFDPAFFLLGAPATWMELLAFVLALIMVACNIREIHWGWPLAIVSSLLYFGVFWRSRLYGDAGLQIFFALMALWGWLQWLRGRRADGSTLQVTNLSPRGRLAALIAQLLLWPAMGWFLAHYTDTDVPWWDGFTTALSIVGQFLLGRKFVENWPVWIVVNVVSVALYAYKGLWLTVVLYLVFIALSVVGWRAWRARAAQGAQPLGEARA